MKIDFIKILKFLSQKWNIIIAAISIVGLLTFNFFPTINESFYKLFIFLGINAIVWTMIEIKIKLEERKPNKTVRYSDMRQARPFILKHIFKEMKANKEATLKIEIVGGRIRTISDMIRELKNEIVTHNLHARNIDIRILTLKPEFVKSWHFTKTYTESHLKKRNEGYANLIIHLTDELISYNSLDEFKHNNIKIKVDFYETFPIFYSYIINEKYIYWGFFTWNHLEEDFIGPENPCFFLDSKDESFRDYFSFITNRVQFLINYKEKCQ
jgi:hypothetical protein